MKQANSQKRMMAAVVIIILIVAAVVAVLYAQRDTTTISPSQTAPSEQTSDTPDADTDAGTDANTDADTDATGISKTEAENIATDKYGGTVKETESDDYQGTPAWEVEIRDSDKGRIEVKVDKQSGDILHVEQD